MSINNKVRITDELNLEDSRIAASAKAIKTVNDLINSKADTTIATIDFNGLMSATDKSKLDGIEEGATAVGHSTTGKTMVDDTEIEHTGQIGDEIFNYSGNIAAGRYAHAEGYKTIADGQYSHAEGNKTYATGTGAHVEGYSTYASGNYSHAEGANTNTEGVYAHAEGYHTSAENMASHAEGYYTQARSDYQHVQGTYNIIDTNHTYAHIVGNGDSTSARSNAHTVDWDGNGWFAGDVKVGGTGQDDEAAKTLATTDVATTETSGLMSTADKSKLDGIATGATKVTTPADIGAATVSAVEAANTAAANAQTTANAAMPKSGGTFTGTVKAKANTAYTTYQVRNIALSTTAAVPTGNGSILGVYA